MIYNRTRRVNIHVERINCNVTLLHYFNIWYVISVRTQVSIDRTFPPVCKNLSWFLEGVCPSPRESNRLFGHERPGNEDPRPETSRLRVHGPKNSPFDRLTNFSTSY